MSTTVTFRTDEELKASATKVYESIGMNLTTALNLFLKQTVIKQNFPCALESYSTKDVRSTYPEGFFELFGTGKDLGLDEEPEELKMDEVEDL